MKSVTLQSAKGDLDALLKLVSEGEEVQIMENDRPIAKLVPAEQEVNWENAFAELDRIWGNRPVPGKPGSEIVRDGRR